MSFGVSKLLYFTQKLPSLSHPIFVVSYCLAARVTWMEAESRGMRETCLREDSERAQRDGRKRRLAIWKIIA